MIMEPPSEENSTPEMSGGLKASNAMGTPVFKSQSRKVSSSDPETRYFLSGENTTIVVRYEWPWSVMIVVPVVVSQIRTVVSSDAEATRSLSGEKVAVVITLEWPWKETIKVPVKASQSRKVQS